MNSPPNQQANAPTGPQASAPEEDDDGSISPDRYEKGPARAPSLRS